VLYDDQGQSKLVWDVFRDLAGGRDVAWWDREGRKLIGYLCPIEEADEVSTDDARADLKEWHDWLQVEQHRIQ